MWRAVCGQVRRIVSRCPFCAGLPHAARQAFPEESYSVGLDENFEFDAEAVRLWYSSMTTPTQVRPVVPAAHALEACDPA